MDIGASLHEARVRRRLTVDDAHRATRIRPQYLEALEEDDFERLPGDAYVKGFLRSYADYLELDGPALVAAYRERTADREPPAAVAQPTALPPPRRSPIAAGTFAVVLATAAVLGWTLGGGDEEEPEPRRTAPAPAAAPPSIPVAEPVPEAPERKPRAAPPVLALAAARGDCWLEVRFGGPAGKLVWTGTLRQGRTLRLGLRKALWIRAGAPHVLLAVVAGERRTLPPGALDLRATAAGIGPA